MEKLMGYNLFHNWDFCFRRISESKQMWITAFSVIMSKIWINPTDLKALNYALRES